MKRTRVLILLLLAAFLMFGCAQTQSVYTVDVSYNGVDMEFTVDTENGTITDGEHVYTYDWDGSDSDHNATITYPNGATYYESMSGGVGNMGWSVGYDPDTYVDGDTLIYVLSVSAPEEPSGNPVVGLILIALGAFYTFAPHAAWYLSYGWRFKDAEPSDAALIISRISGVAVAVFGLFTLFV